MQPPDQNPPTGEDVPLSKIVESIDLSTLNPAQANWVRQVLDRYAAEHSTFEDEGGAQALEPHSDYDKLTPYVSITDILRNYEDIEG